LDAGEAAAKSKVGVKHQVMLAGKSSVICTNVGKPLEGRNAELQVIREDLMRKDKISEHKRAHLQKLT